MEKAKSVMVVEDEIIIAESICDTLRYFGYEVLEPCISYEEAIKMLKESPPDIAVLDIKLKDNADGIDVALYIRKHLNIPIVFLTANTDEKMVERTKAVFPNAYLSKPFQNINLFASLELAFNNFSHGMVQKVAESPVVKSIAPSFIFIKEGNYLIKLIVNDVEYMKSDNVYVTIHTSKNKHVLRTTLPELQEKFDPNKFVRVHMRYVVNIDKIVKINSKYLLIDNEEIPVSDTYYDSLLSRLIVA